MLDDLVYSTSHVPLDICCLHPLFTSTTCLLLMVSVGTLITGTDSSTPYGEQGEFVHGMTAPNPSGRRKS